MTEDLMIGLGVGVVGLIVIIFSKQISKFSVYIETLPLFRKNDPPFLNRNINPFQVKFRQAIYILGGLVFVLMGLISIYHHFHIFGNH